MRNGCFIRTLWVAAIFLLLLTAAGCISFPPSGETLTGYFFTLTREGMARIDETGSTDIVAEGGQALDVWQGELYILRSTEISVVDVEGRAVSEIPIPEEILDKHFSGFTVTGERGFAVFNNADDLVYFLSPSGELVTTVPLPVEPNSRWQNTYGVVVGNDLIISEDGNKRLIAIDLETLDVSVFRDLSHLPSWLGAIAYDGQRFYLCGPRRIYSFVGNEEPEVVAEVPTSNLSGLVVVNGYLYACTNSGGTLYRIDPETGEVTDFVTGLNFPDYLVFIRRTG